MIVLPFSTAILKMVTILSFQIANHETVTGTSTCL